MLSGQKQEQPLRRLPLREGVDLNFSAVQLINKSNRLPLREGVDLNIARLVGPRMVSGLPLREGVDLNVIWAKTEVTLTPSPSA